MSQECENGDPLNFGDDALDNYYENRCEEYSNWYLILYRTMFKKVKISEKSISNFSNEYIEFVKKIF